MIDVQGAVKSGLQTQWQKLFKKINKLLRYLFGVPLPPVLEVKMEALETDLIMRKARVRLSWTLSPSDDALHQSVKVVDPDDGQIFFDEKLGPEISEVVLPELVSEKQRLQAVVVVSDGLNESVPAVVDFTVPDLTAPAPVENLGFSYEPVDVEEENV